MSENEEKLLPQAGVEPGVEGVSAPPEAGRVEEPKKGRRPGLDLVRQEATWSQNANPAPFSEGERLRAAGCSVWRRRESNPSPRTPCPGPRRPAAASGPCSPIARRIDPPRATGGGEEIHPKRLIPYSSIFRSRSGPEIPSASAAAGFTP